MTSHCTTGSRIRGIYSVSLCFGPRKAEHFWTVRWVTSLFLQTGPNSRWGSYTSTDTTVFVYTWRSDLCVFSLRSCSRWAVVGLWRELWILLRLLSAHKWWTLWWGSAYTLSTRLRSVFFNTVCVVFTHALSLSVSLECILVQSGLVLDLLHPQHNLFYQTSQVLPENEVLWSVRVSAVNGILQTCVLTYIHIPMCTQPV